jgi:hypothetical protein
LKVDSATDGKSDQEEFMVQCMPGEATSAVGTWATVTLSCAPVSCGVVPFLETRAYINLDYFAVDEFTFGTVLGFSRISFLVPFV